MPQESQSPPPADQTSEAAGATQQGASGNAAGADAALDFEQLDLTVETVEERISPSETNVFDK